MATKTQPTRDEIIKQVVSELDKPTSIEDVIDEVLRRWPTRAKNPKGTLRSHMRRYMTADSLLILDEMLVAPTGMVMQGVRFRVRVTPEEAEKGCIEALPSFQFFWKRELLSKQIDFRDVQGEPITSTVQIGSRQERGPWGEYTATTTKFQMAEWFRREGVRANDSVIVTVEDWDTGQFRLETEIEDTTLRHQTEIEVADRRLIDWVYNRLDNSGSEMILLEPTILAAYAQNCVYPAYPGNHWIDAMQEDGRMVSWDGHTIRYADAPSPFDFLFDDDPEEEEIAEQEAEPLSQEVAEKVFTFYAYSKHRKTIWRRIEIQGEHDLQDFDDILRSAFGHDWDHLSGFWRRIRRGNTKQFREIELATTSFFSEYRKNAYQQVGSLELKVGDQLKYIYDFGDWIEYTIEVEAISVPLAGVEYPRISERNAPRYRSCTNCKKNGKSTTAIWICYTCSDADKDILLCAECAKDEEHEDHYLEEILY